MSTPDREAEAEAEKLADDLLHDPEVQTAILHAVSACLIDPIPLIRQRIGVSDREAETKIPSSLAISIVGSIGGAARLASIPFSFLTLVSYLVGKGIDNVVSTKRSATSRWTLEHDRVLWQHDNEESSQPRIRSIRPDETKSNLTEATRTAEIHRLFDGLPDDHAACYDILSNASRVFKASLAEAYAPRFNKHLRSLPQQTHEEKKALASWANDQLRNLDIAIKCPVTGKPATLVIDRLAAGIEASRFRLQIRNDEGKRTRVFVSGSLPELTLMPAEYQPRRGRER